MEKVNSVLSNYKIISFCGVDGAGKTTQMRLLLHFLEKEGVPTKKVWIRSPHTFAFFLWKFFKKLGYSAPPLNSNFDRNVWLWMEFLSIIPKILFSVKLPILFGKKLVAERLVVDSIVTISFYFLDNLKFINSKQSRLLLRFVLPETYFIHIQVDPDTVLTRRLNRGYIDDYHLLEGIDEKAFKESIKKQQEIYRELVKNLNGITLDTTDLSIEAVYRLLKDHLCGIEKH